MSAEIIVRFTVINIICGLSTIILLVLFIVILKIIGIIERFTVGFEF